MFFLSLFIFPAFFDYLFGQDEIGLYPIYSGIILLSGLIVACTKIVLEKIQELEEKQSGKNIEK